MKEQWKRVADFARYEVSDLGRVRNILTGRVLRAGRIKSGYLIVCLCGHDKPHTVRVSRLVAQAFIPNPENLPEVNHRDTHKTNNAASNLEWRSGLGNTQHATQHDCRGDGVYFAKDRNKWVAAYAPTPHAWKHIGIYDTYTEAKAARDAVIQSQEEIL